MPFIQKPVPRTYIDITQVTDPEHERLKIVFENGAIVLLKISTQYDQAILEVDKIHSDHAALETSYRYCYDNQKHHKVGTSFFGITTWKQRSNFSMSEVRAKASLTADPSHDNFFGGSIMIGHPLKISVGFVGIGGSGTVLADGSLIASIESVVIDS